MIYGISLIAMYKIVAGPFMSERSSQKSLKTLAHLQLFEEFPVEAWQELELRCTWRTTLSNEHIIGHLDESSDVFFLVSGKAKVLLYSEDGKEVTFREICEGSVFGELAAIDGRARSATVISKDECVLAAVSSTVFMDLLKSNPSFMIAMMRHLVKQIRTLTDRVFEFSTLDVANRLHSELLRLSFNGLDQAGRAVIDNFPTHEEIASRISTHRQAVTTELGRLETAGIISRKGKTIEVIDVKRLEMLISTKYAG